MTRWGFVSRPRTSRSRSWAGSRMAGMPQWIPVGLGTWGMDEFVEPHVRRLVAEHLAVGVEDLLSHVSLRDDLAADSLDLVELALALEGEFAIVVPERILDEVRTFGELVRAIGLRICARRDAEARGAEPAPRIWARIVPATGESTGTLERTGWLTPYTAETIREDAVRAGPGTRLEMTIAANTTEGFVRAQRRFAGLDRRGVRVSIQRDDELAPLPLQSIHVGCLAEARAQVDRIQHLDRYLGREREMAEHVADIENPRERRARSAGPSGGTSGPGGAAWPAARLDSGRAPSSAHRSTPPGRWARRCDGRPG
jgi:acyl carrier protein